MGINVVNKKIGFCCKFVPTQSFKSPKEEKSWIDSYNIKGTTVTALEKLSHKDRVDRILGLINTNIQNLKNQFDLMGTWEPSLRMLRIGSDVLPVKTHPSIAAVYQEPSVIKAMQALEKAGDIARKHDIRLSMHPGQFTLLCSKSGDDVIQRSIQDLEYHADVFRLLGYDSTDLQQEINIHGGARRDDFTEQFLNNFKNLSTDLQNWLSVENDEFSYSLDDLLPISDKVKICLDIHHYWIHHGVYINSADTRLEQVIASWRGARPEMHVSWTHEDVLGDHSCTVLPDMALLESAGFNKSKLRAHSSGAWNSAIASYALEFWDRFDLCVEAKNKNIAAKQLYDFGK